MLLIGLWEFDSPVYMYSVGLEMSMIMQNTQRHSVGVSVGGWDARLS